MKQQETYYHSMVVERMRSINREAERKIQVQIINREILSVMRMKDKRDRDRNGQENKAGNFEKIDKKTG